MVAIFSRPQCVKSNGVRHTCIATLKFNITHYIIELQYHDPPPPPPPANKKEKAYLETLTIPLI